MTGTAAAPIRTFLDLSTAHLPQDLGDRSIGGGLHCADGVTAYPMKYGYLMWVPDEPTEYAAMQDDGVPAEVVAIQLYARANGCDWVMLDGDADTVNELPTWKW